MRPKASETFKHDRPVVLKRKVSETWSHPGSLVGDISPAGYGCNAKIVLHVPSDGDHEGNGTTGISVFPFGPATHRHTSTGTQVYQPCSSVITVSFLFFKTCSESVRARAAKSDWLRDLFLPNITLFIDKRYFNDSEWNRLEHFIPPYGFMDLNYSRESLRAWQDGTFSLLTGTLC